MFLNILIFIHLDNKQKENRFYTKLEQAFFPVRSALDFFTHEISIC